MRRAPVIGLLLVATTLAGCQSPERLTTSLAGCPSPESVAHPDSPDALAAACRQPPAPPEPTPIRDWVRKHPGMTAVGVVFLVATGVVVAGYLALKAAGPGLQGG